MQGRTGQLSFITTFLQFLGSAVRIFTSIKEAAGPAMVRGFALGAAVNGAMLAQIAWYGPTGRGLGSGGSAAAAPPARSTRKKAKAV
jgi:hypothetical protein